MRDTSMKKSIDLEGNSKTTTENLLEKFDWNKQDLQRDGIFFYSAVWKLEFIHEPIDVDERKRPLLWRDSNSRSR